MRCSPWFALAAAVGIARPAFAQETLAPRIGATLAGLEAELIAFRRDLHRHPEVSGAEERTASKVAERLRALGIETRTGVGGHGVVGVLRGGRPGPVVAYRADMDAVYSSDPDPVEFRSMVPGVRHICGHDVHTTIGIALAAGLASHRRDLAGTVLFVFQPAEERATGALAMLAAGVFRDPPPVAIYGVHTAPFPVGQLATIAGDMMSGRDRYRVAIHGEGDRGAATAAVRTRLAALGTVAPAEILRPAPRDLVLVTPPQVAESAGVTLLSGTIMATSLSRPAVTKGMREIGALAQGGTVVTPRYQPKTIAGVFNDSALTVRATAAAEQVLGAGNVVPVEVIVPAFSEDFGSFQDLVPGVFFFLGVSNPAKGTVGMPHTPDYVADEGAILVGARAMAAVLLDRLGRP
ncbi:MAG: amidohydrolase [Gemmatimonadetes bacterium]|nr:amidohydrolase [Gemmatimonadota bacterium]